MYERFGERVLIGTSVMDNVRLAVQMGHEVVDVSEVYEYHVTI